MELRNSKFAFCKTDMMSHVCINYQFGCGILKMVGPKKIRFLAKNQHTPKANSLKNYYKEYQFIENWA